MARSRNKRRMLAAWAVAGLVAVGAAGCASSSSSSSSVNEPSQNASEDNTPRVGPNGSVEVDDLRWRLDHASSEHALGDPESGLGATANGVFVVVTLHVTNNKNESATMTSDIVNLVAGKKTYNVDSGAETALIGSSKTFLLQELGPNVSLTGKAGFDVDPAVLHEHPELRFNELGFGSTHGYIALPRLSG